jgi:predicted nuclease of restriction endonuclease-like RecB superfamily
MRNVKIINATPKTYNNIKFKSLAEVMVYKTLIQQGFSPQYEQETFIIWEGYKPTITFFTKNTFKRKNKNIEVVSKSTVKDNRNLTNITYTPDFTLMYNGIKVIIEVKGFQNDVFPYKFKMFRKHLESLEGKYELWKIFTKKQLLECINHLKQQL